MIVELVKNIKVCKGHTILRNDFSFMKYDIGTIHRILTPNCSLPGWLNWLRRHYCSMASFASLSPTRGGRLVADACDQQPFEPGE